MDVEQHLRYFLGIFIPSLEKSLFLSVTYFSLGGLFSRQYVEFLSIFNLNPLSDAYLAKVNSDYMDFLFSQGTVFCYVQKHFAFIYFHLAVLPSIAE